MNETNVYVTTDHGAVTSPEVSFVIVNFNKSELTLKCLVSIVQYIGDGRFEAIVVDNGSSAADLAALDRGCARAGARLIRLNRNLFFAEASNIGAEAARAKYLLFVNNDVTLQPGCLEALLEGMRQGFRAGAIGPRFVYPDGRLQEAGAYIRPDGSSLQHGKSGQENGLIAGPGLHVVDYCSAACLMVRRDAFLHLAGFDLLFEPAYFEDADLCLRLRSIGLYTYFCGDATVIHEENATSATVWSSEQFNMVMAQSHRRFVARWGQHVVERVQAVNVPSPAAQVNWQPEPQWSGERPTVYVRGDGPIVDSGPWKSLIRFAAGLDGRYAVVFLAEEACSRCRIYGLCRDLKVLLRDFSIRRGAEIIPGDGDTIASFEGEPGTDGRVHVSGPASQDICKSAILVQTP